MRGRDGKVRRCSSLPREWGIQCLRGHRGFTGVTGGKVQVQEEPSRAGDSLQYRLMQLYLGVWFRQSPLSARHAPAWH